MIEYLDLLVKTGIIISVLLALLGTIEETLESRRFSIDNFFENLKVMIKFIMLLVISIFMDFIN